MFRTLINDVKSAAGGLVAKYAVRVSVAVPFVVAAGFATAALTHLLVERVGSTAAYGIMAAGFGAIGLIAAAVVSAKEHEEAVADADAETDDTAEVASEAAAQAAGQLPLALLGTLFTTPMGPRAAMSGAKMIGRNLPLLALLMLIAFLFWPDERTRDAEQAADQDEDVPTPTPEQWQSPNGVDRYAA